MKRKECYIARLDEVTITRDGDSAVIRYKEEGILTTHLKIGPEIAGMSDEAILELFNDTLRAQAQLAAEYKHVAVEVPLGSPQIEYFARGYQWCLRGGVLRCLVEDDENKKKPPRRRPFRNLRPLRPKAVSPTGRRRERRPR